MCAASPYVQVLVMTIEQYSKISARKLQGEPIKIATALKISIMTRHIQKCKGRV